MNFAYVLMVRCHVSLLLSLTGFVRVLLTVCHVSLLLSSTMLYAGLVDSMSCVFVAVFDHASCGSC